MIPDTTTTWDQPTVTVNQTFLICTAPRTGSNLLAFSLAEQRCGIPLEYLNIYSNPPMQGLMMRMLGIPPNHHLTIETLAQLKYLRQKYMGQLLQHRVTSNGAFGMKVFSNHIQVMFPEAFELQPLLDLLPTPPKLIHLYRNDLCSMAVSYYFALEQQEWYAQTKESGTKSALPYDYTKLLTHLNMLHDIQTGWQTLLQPMAPKQILSVNYKTMTDDFNTLMQQVNQFLGLEHPSISTTPIQKQSSPEKAAMVERFKAECMEKEPWVFDVDYRLNTDGTDQPQ